MKSAYKEDQLYLFWSVQLIVFLFFFPDYARHRYVLFAILPAVICGLLFLKCMYTFFLKKKSFQMGMVFQGQKMINLKMKTTFDILVVSQNLFCCTCWLGFPEILHYPEAVGILGP